MKKDILSLIVPALIFSSCIQNADVPDNDYEGNFEALWSIIDTRYCYLDVKHIDWDSVYDVYHARLATDTVDEITFFDAMGDMLAELKDGHVNLYSGFDRSRYWNWFTDYPSNFNADIIGNDRYLGNDYRSVNGFRYQRIANGRVGYLYYSSFSDGFSDQNMSYVFRYFQDCNGLIIDVRNNGGGSAELSNQLASYFFPRDTVSLYMRHKTGPGHSDFSEAIPVKTTAHKTIQWQRPVIILTNRSAYSATNMFVCRMKDAPMGLIVGDITGGGGGMPLSNELPNGWMVRFSAVPMYDAQMNDIEFGIEPDVYKMLTPADEANGKDTLIEYAVGLLTGNS